MISLSISDFEGLCIIYNYIFPLADSWLVSELRRMMEQQQQQQQQPQQHQHQERQQQEQQQQRWRHAATMMTRANEDNDKQLKATVQASGSNSRQLTRQNVMFEPRRGVALSQDLAGKVYRLTMEGKLMWKAGERFFKGSVCYNKRTSWFWCLLILGLTFIFGYTDNAQRCSTKYDVCNTGIGMIFQDVWGILRVCKQNMSWRRRSHRRNFSTFDAAVIRLVV